MSLTLSLLEWFLLKWSPMYRQQLRKKAQQPVSPGSLERPSRRPTSYPKTRIRGSRLLKAARILALVELTRRLHQACEHAYDKQAADRLLPQDPVTESIHWWDLAKILSDVKAIAARGRCQEFLTNLLGRAGDTGGDKAVHTNIVDLFVAVASQKGFVTQREVRGRGFSSVRGAVGAPGGAEVRLSNGSNDFIGNPKLRIQYFAYDAISELTHVAGSVPSSYATGAFSDYHLAKTALDVANEMGGHNEKLGLPTVDPKNDPYGKWSDTYHHIVSLYCKRQERF